MPPEPPSAIAPTEQASPGNAATAPAPQTAGSELPPGHLAGDYRVIRKIGGGAMGDVYEGEAAAIGKRVAIKVLKNIEAASDEAAERFLREARAVNKISHPNVLDVFAFGKLEDGRLYLVMDLLTGESLGERLRRGGAMDAEEFGAVIEPICRALDAAHQAGIIHRDLKPENVFLAEVAGQTHVYVLDFGIAKMLSDAAEGQGQVTLTGEGVWIGTPAYMSPEQWAADPATAQSDVYALGCTAFEMLSGRVPFKADSVPGIMQKHFNEEPPAIDRSDAIPGPFEQTIRDALAKDPLERPAGALEFFARLSGGEHAGRKRSGSRLVQALALGLTAAVIVVAALVLRGGGGGESSASLGQEPAAAAASDEAWMLAVTAVPDTATIVVRGREPTKGQLVIDDIDASDSIVVRVKAPGYIPSEQTFTAADAGTVKIVLDQAMSFEGIWSLEDGSLRQLVRKGDLVSVLYLETLQSEPQLLGQFHFIENQSSWIRFEAGIKMVDPRAPDEASCQFELISQYRFRQSGDSLELRRQIARVGFSARTRTCTVGEAKNLGWEKATRVKHASTEVRWAVSRGSGKVVALAISEGKRVLADGLNEKLNPPVQKDIVKESPKERLARQRREQRARDKAKKAKELKANRAAQKKKLKDKPTNTTNAANPSRGKDAPKAPALGNVQGDDVTDQKKAPKQQRIKN